MLERANVLERETKQEVANLKLTNFSPSETFHLLRSELKEFTPQSIWDLEDINFKKTKQITILIK